VKRLATIATEYVVVKQGMYEEWKKIRIYGKGAEVYKSIYIKGTQRR
jgi:single-stranded DNA-binding protein